MVGFDTDSNLNESSALAQDQHGIVRLFALIDYGKTTHSSQEIIQICGIRSADFALSLLQRRIVEICPVSGGSSWRFWEWYWFSVSSSYYPSALKLWLHDCTDALRAAVIVFEQAHANLGDREGGLSQCGGAAKISTRLPHLIIAL